MRKVIMIAALIILGLFTVYVINNGSTRPNAVSEENADLFPTVPDSSPLQTLGSTSSTPSVTSAPTITSSPPITSTPVSEEKASSAVIKTSKGNIELTLFPGDAPNTVTNFINKAKSGFYANKIFHRVEDWVIQGGDPLGNGTGGGDMLTELNSKPFVVGSLGVARGGDIKISNDSQFFITKTDAAWLNNQYTNFGIVTKGMDVVNKISIGDKILTITVQ